MKFRIVYGTVTDHAIHKNYVEPFYREGWWWICDSIPENKSYGPYSPEGPFETKADATIRDTMRYIKPNVSTLCIGQAASMGAMILAAGEKGKRYALPNARVMCHQPSGGARGMASDIEIQAKEILKTKALLNQMLVEDTGKNLKTIEKIMDRDTWFTADEAKEFGLVDKVVAHRA